MEILFSVLGVLTIYLIIKEMGVKRSIIALIIIVLASTGNQFIDYKNLGNIGGSLISAPAGEVKLRAYVDNASPAVHSTTNLIVYGPPGGKVTAICHFKEHDEPYIFEVGKEGMEIKTIKVSTVLKGYTVVIDVILDYNGKTYRTSAVFTPN